MKKAISKIIYALGVSKEPTRRRPELPLGKLKTGTLKVQ